MSDVERRESAKHHQTRPKSFPAADDAERSMQPAVRQDHAIPVYGELSTRSGRESAPLPQTSSSSTNSPSLLVRQSSFHSSGRNGRDRDVALEKIRRSLRPYAVNGSDLAFAFDRQVSVGIRRESHILVTHYGGVASLFSPRSCSLCRRSHRSTSRSALRAPSTAPRTTPCCCENLERMRWRSLAWGYGPLTHTTSPISRDTVYAARTAGFLSSWRATTSSGPTM